MHLLSTNPGLLVWLVIFVVTALVLALLGVFMRRGGVSRRPLAWFAGFMLLIGLPQFFGHLYLALTTAEGGAPRTGALTQLVTAERGEAYAAAVKRLFGPDADPMLVIDARTQFGDVLAQAQVARFAAIGGKESVLLARFSSYTEAERAWVGYLRITGLGKAGGKGDSQAGYVVDRPAGDRLYAVHMHDLLGVWTGPDDNAIRDRVLTGGFEIPRRTPLRPTTAGAIVSRQGTAQLQTSSRVGRLLDGSAGIALVAVGGIAYLILVVLYFFRGAAWAGSVPARPGATPVSAAELERRLQAVNALDVPFRIERSGDTLTATWRYADAKWMDHARVHGLRRTHRIRMRLDTTGHVVRATDAFSTYDWSAGGSGANLQWKTGLGITFFQVEQQRVFGLQLDDAGRFIPKLSYAYTFNLQEMKAPLIDAVTRAGWTWRPVIWQGPAWLRWLTS